MLKNNLKFLIRVFLKDKFFSILNIAGLGLGIAISIVLLLILQNDLTYDKHYENHKLIYRLGGHLEATGVDFRHARSARELGNIVKDEIGNIDAVTRINDWDSKFVKYDSRENHEGFYQDKIVRTDSNYFKVFSHEFIAGNPAKSLLDDNSVVLTQSTAKKYFGDEDPINKILTIEGSQWHVTGVIKDLPENTHLRFELLLSGLVDRKFTDEKGAPKSEAFWNPDVFTYFLVTPNFRPEEFESRFQPVFNKYFKSFGDQVGGKYTPVLEPLTSIHFHSDLGADMPHGNINYVYAFTGIGVFIILLACINYMNLSTAKSINRAAEIAMKKTLGSGKRALMMSFLGESVFLSFVSLVFALFIVYTMLSFTSFNELVGRNLTLDFFHNPLLIAGSVSITLLIGVVSGLYPAFYLPRIPTISALKGSFKNQKSSLMLRKVLTTTQFAISIFVVVCTLFMKEQINYVRTKDLGFTKENVLLLPIRDSLVQATIGSIKTEFLRNPHIISATTSYSTPGLQIGGPVMWAESSSGMKQQAFKMMTVGENYFKTLDIKVIAGRSFNEGSEADTQGDAFIINEAAAKLMGWGKDPIGKKIKFFHAKEDGHVIGMVKDFNFQSLHNAVEPLIILKAGSEGGHLYLRLTNQDLPATIASIKEKWTKLDPEHPFEYFFLDQQFDEQYKSDEAQFKLVTGLSYICIFISLLGLLGLSAFSAAQRTKEIGVRKVMGASIPQIVYLLFKDVMVLVLIASVLVVPAVWYTMTGWMNNFAYHLPISYGAFVITTLLAILVTFLTVGFHSLKTARTNPVVSLKYE